jgi:Maltokinase N-terminal cap domain
MALIHRATLEPSKLALLTAWLPSRTWFTGETDVRQVGAYRFDDPAGEVGIETILVQAGDRSVLHLPLTYRGEPLAEAEDFLVGTLQHSVLGTRWVYDGCGDPVWATALLTTVLTGGTQVEELVDVDGHLEPREPTATVLGSGAPGAPVPDVDRVSSHDEGDATIVRAGAVELVVVRVVGAEVAAEQVLTGRWAGGGPAVLAGVLPVG